MSLASSVCGAGVASGGRIGSGLELLKQAKAIRLGPGFDDLAALDAEHDDPRPTRPLSGRGNPTAVVTDHNASRSKRQDRACAH